jgi:hypothetical protein
VGRRPEQVVDRRDARQLLGEGIKSRAARGLLPGNQRLRPRPGCYAAGQDRNGREQDKSGDVLGIADLQGVQRVEKKEIVAENRQDRRREPRP